PDARASARLVEAAPAVERTPGGGRFDEPPELSRDHGVAWRPIVKRVGPLPRRPARSRIIGVVAEHAQEEIRERLDDRPRVDRGPVRRGPDAALAQDKVGEPCRVGMQVPAASPVRRARLSAARERAATQQALGAAIARRRVEPGKERPVDRHGAELDLAVGQHASEHVATVGLVAARVVGSPADRASVPREPEEPGRLPAGAGADGRAPARASPRSAAGVAGPRASTRSPPWTSWSACVRNSTSTSPPRPYLTFERPRVSRPSSTSMRLRTSAISFSCARGSGVPY